MPEKSGCYISRYSKLTKMFFICNSITFYVKKGIFFDEKNEPLYTVRLL